MNDSSQHPTASILSRTLKIALVVVILAVGVSAQTNGSTPVGLSPGSPSGSYPLSDFETVNLFNGGLNFRLPLLSIGGRGGTGYSLPIHIEQKWSISKEIHPHGNPDYSGHSSWWSEDLGVARKLDVGRLQVRRAGTEDFYGPDGCAQYRYRKTVTRITFTAPDGTEYELRDQLTGGQPVVPAACSSGFNRQKVFVTADGTSATYISDVDIIDAYWWSEAGEDEFRTSGDMMLKDGTHFRVDDGKVSWMRDRNGNKASFAYDYLKRVTAITDSLNRQVTIAYDISSGGYTYYDQISFKGFGGASRTIKIGHCFRADAMRSDISVPSPLFSGLTVDNSNPFVINYVELPDGRRYQIQYNAYAEIARVVLPTGGAIEYDWANGLTDGAASGLFTVSGDKYVYRRVVERRLYPDGGSGSGYESKMTYSRPETTTTNAGYVVVDQYNSSGTLLGHTQHYFYGSARASFLQKQTDYPAWQDSREYKTETFDSNGFTLLRRVENTFAQRDTVSWWTGGSTTAPPNDVRPTETVTTLADTNQMSKQSFGYDDTVPFNNQNSVKEYDFGSGGVGALLRETRTTYLTDASYTGTTVHVRNLPLQVSVYEGENVRARSTYEYDNYTPEGSDCSHSYHCPLVPRSNISGFDSSFGSGYTMRGNVTGTTRYLITNGSVPNCDTSPSLCVSSYTQYDIIGNAVKSIDPRSTLANIIATTLDYDDRFGTPDGEARANAVPQELSGLTTYALPTKVTNALGHTAYSQFDYYLGKPVDGEDANGVVASGYYNDPLDRPKQVKRAVGTATENHSTFDYDDTYRIITTTSDFATNNDGALVSKLLYDQMGRTIETRQYEGVSNYIATQTQYDVLGRAYKTSNPFRPWQSETAIWTTSAFDALGRVISVTTPDNAVASTAYSGAQVLVTDQAGKQRMSQTNALGQLKDVWEIKAADAETEAVSFPGHTEVTAGYRTSYSYDTLDDLTGVTQGAQPSRTFAYDSLKRLTSATNPESGAISYVYDAAGNLTQKTDARPITTTIAYDALNRPTSKSYNDTPQTPTVNYFYDAQTLPSGAPTFDRGYAMGHLVAVTYGGGSAGNYTGFDALGRTLRKIQQTDSVNYLSEASYNVSSMVSETYPSVPGYSDRRGVAYTFDAAGRPSSATTGATSYAPGASVSAITYAAHGALSSETYGNNRVHGVTYNNRLQASAITLGTAFNPISILNLSYSYGTTNNNGNLQSVSHLAAGIVYTQTFSYDALNRLAAASETWGGTSWTQTNGYDRYGNRWIDLGGGNQSLYFTPSTNQISGWSYDAAGNLLNDGAHAYTYDAENKIRTVDGTTAYVYDGEGQRVRKLVGENTRFVYGIGGQVIMEFSGSSGSLTKEYVYGGGSMATIGLASKSGVAVLYLTSDHLGTPRVVTKADGSVAARHDYKPFGEEIFAGTGGRTTGQGYSVTDGVRQKFTSKERDNETGLDYFGARYYASMQGRFTSPDPLLVNEERLIDPQQINLYHYARNNPLRFSDPTGEDIDDSSLKDNEDYQKWKTAFRNTAAGKAFWEKYSRPEYKVKISMGDNAGGKNGAETTPTFDASGKMTGGTIVLGTDFAKKEASGGYPIGSTLTPGDHDGSGYPLTPVDREARAVAFLAHEFGHLEDDEKMGMAAWQREKDLLTRNLKGFEAMGQARWFNSPEYRQLQAQCGCSNVSDLAAQREIRADGYTRGVLKDYYGKGAGHGRMPGRVKDAIKNYEKEHPQ